MARPYLPPQSSTKFPLLEGLRLSMRAFHLPDSLATMISMAEAPQLHCKQPRSTLTCSKIIPWLQVVLEQAI